MTFSKRVFKIILIIIIYCKAIFTEPAAYGNYVMWSEKNKFNNERLHNTRGCWIIFESLEHVFVGISRIYFSVFLFYRWTTQTARAFMKQWNSRVFRFQKQELWRHCRFACAVFFSRWPNRWHGGVLVIVVILVTSIHTVQYYYGRIAINWSRFHYC